MSNGDDVIKDFLDEAGGRMAKSVESTRNEFSTVRTGRASPHQLDRIVVDYYGTQTPLRQLATINAPEARLLTVQPYDQSSIMPSLRGCPPARRRLSGRCSSRRSC